MYFWDAITWHDSCLYISKSTFKEKIMKTITLYRPNAMQHALSDLDRYFDYFYGDSPLASATKVINRVPAVDIRETEKTYVLEMELPGYDEKNIDLHIDGSKLSIASKQEETQQENEPPAESTPPAESWILRERRVTSFTRSFKLPENANPEEVSAEFKNGILSMTIQKRAEAQKRTIQINVGH
jgi:HSP20 family protein